MAKLKLTKAELKAQMDDLKRFNRFLPTLQLKKQQLQLEIRKSQSLFEENERKFKELRARLSRWTALLGDENIVELITGTVKIKRIVAGENNIAGVNVPIFERVEFSVKEVDLFNTEFYVSAAIDAVQQLISILEAGKILRRQYELLQNELRTTTQRVNLFEKVKIPECKENIRKIRIYMGDQDTSAVARSKLAKNKTQNLEVPGGNKEDAA